MGLTLASVDIADLNPLKAFKGQLTVLMVSMLFILLSGGLDLSAIQGRAWIDLLSGKSFQLPLWTRRLEDGDAGLETVDVDDDEKAATLRSRVRENAEAIAMVCGWKDGKPIFEVSVDHLEEMDRVTLLAQKSPL
jgi:hypothetical protein